VPFSAGSFVPITVLEGVAEIKADISKEASQRYRLPVHDHQSIYRYLDEERANLEASAAKQLELQQLNNSSN
jgi:hypothetical protein